MTKRLLNDKYLKKLNHIQPASQFKINFDFNFNSNDFRPQVVVASLLSGIKLLCLNLKTESNRIQSNSIQLKRIQNICVISMDEKSMFHGMVKKSVMHCCHSFVRSRQVGSFALQIPFIILVFFYDFF